MQITEIRAMPVTVPLEALLRHANGCRWGRFVCTIVEVEPDNGLVGLGEMGGGESATAAFEALKPYLLGRDPARIEGARKPDREKLCEYHELFLRLGSYSYDQDPLRPVWTPLIPNDRWADSLDERMPVFPF